MATNQQFRYLSFNGNQFDYYVELKRHRENKGLTQTQLANACGVSKNTISLIENQVSNPSLELLIKICVVLDISVYELLEIVDLKTLEPNGSCKYVIL